MKDDPSKALAKAVLVLITLGSVVNIIVEFFWHRH